MKISWTAIGALALAGLAAATLAMLGRSVIPDPFGPPRLDFVYPSMVTAGPDGLVVVSDSGDRRIIGMERDGSLRFVVAGQRRKGGFYNGRALGFDAGGRFYVDDAVLDRRTGNASSESLLAFDSRGRRLEPAYSREFSAEESADVLVRLLYSQVSPDFLSWFFPDPDGTWALHRLPLDGSPGPGPVRYEGYDVYDTVDAAFGQDGACWLLERSGSVLRREGDGPLEQWYWDMDGLLRFPVAMVAGPAGSIYILEGKTSVVRLDPGTAGATATVVLDHDSAVRAGYDRPLALANLSVSADGSLWSANETTGEALAFHPDGSLESWGGAGLTGRWALLRVALMAAWISAGLCLAAAAVLFYVKIFGMKARLLLKQLSILMPLTALAVGAIAWSVYLRMDRGVQAETESRLRHLAQLTAAGLSADAVDSIDPGAGRLEEVLGSEGFRETVSVLDGIVNLNQDSWNSNLFPYVYFRRGGEWFIAGGFDYLELYPYAYSKPEFLSVLDGGREEYYRYADVYGSWLSALTPLFREDGTVAAVVEASMGADFLDELERATLGRIALSTAGLLFLLLGVFTVFDAMLLRSVKALKDGADRVSGGDYGVPVEIRSRDEIEELGDAFNSMSDRIKESLDELSRLGRANARFVPTEFLAQLGRASITEIGLGDQKLTEMCVMFSDIRAFTQHSERMGPTATMDMLNDYLSRMGPAVREAGGFIDKYVGDAIMALFPHRPLDAVDAVLAMMDCLDTFRAELLDRGEPDVEAGYGIHCGSLMLGVIGEEERFEGTVIADAVNLASRLESLTKYYGVRALMSGAVKDGLDGQRRPYRFLDLVRVKGKTEQVRLYELVGAGDPARAGKLGGAAEYIRGFEEYRRGRFAEAAPRFAALADAEPGDRPARMMHERCLRMAAEGAPAGWRGVTEFHDK